jgi:viroplasmin and RNaseH domain-containing protein
MEENGVTKWKEVIRDIALDTTPKARSTAYYVVAYGAKPGIYPEW